MILKWRGQRKDLAWNKNLNSEQTQLCLLTEPLTTTAFQQLFL
jgi:hypothetical protein